MFNIFGDLTVVSLSSGGWALTYFALELGIWACVVSAGCLTGLGLCFCGGVLVASTMKVQKGKQQRVEQF